MDRVHGVTPQPVAGSLSAMGAHSGGGGSLESSRWHHALDSALEPLYYSANYVYVCAGEQEVQWGVVMCPGVSLLVMANSHGSSTERGSRGQRNTET